MLIHSPESQPGIATIPLLLEPLCLIGPATGVGKLSGKPVKLAELVSRPLIMPRRPNHFRVRFDYEAALQGITPNIGIEIDGHSVLQAWSVVAMAIPWTLLERPMKVRARRR